MKSLGLAWTAELKAGPPSAPGGFGGFGRLAGGAPVIVGGDGTAEFSGSPSVKGAILMVGGVLYVTAPDNVWALDAHDGRELWRYFWKTRGGTHIGNRGAALWHNYLFFETPDNYLVSLDARTGKERWHVEIASFEEQYFSTVAPVVVGDHVLVGTGNDLDMPGFLQSFDPETGKLQWKIYTVPMNPGDPGLETWPSLEAARHGGGQAWVPGAYDPETKLYIIGTGNPTPAYTGQPRRGDNLFTCSLVAVNVDTGKMAWYYQTSPHDTHDWDSAQTPVLIDGVIDGKPRKLVATAARNGYFFTLDRVTGELVVSSKFGTTTNWAKGLRKNGAPDPNPGKEATIPGSLVSPVEGGVTNWPPPAFSPADRPLLRPREKRLQHPLSHRSRPARLDGARRQGRGAGRRVADRLAGDRLPHGQGGLAPRVSGRERRGRLGRPAGDGGQAPLRRRRRRQPRRVRREERHAACGTRASARSATPRRPTWSTAASTCWPRSATRCTRSRSTEASYVGAPRPPQG